MLRIPSDPVEAARWASDIVDECMATAGERAQQAVKANQYYWTGTTTGQAAIMNKVKPFVNRYAGYLYQPSTVRFNCSFISSEDSSVLERGRTASQVLTAEYRGGDSDLDFSAATLGASINGCFLIKHLGHGKSFRTVPVHPVNFGVLSESITRLRDQEAFCHVSYPTVSRLEAMLDEMEHPNRRAIIDEIRSKGSEEEDREPFYYHQLVVGGLNPVGNPDPGAEAAGVVRVFPTPTPWRMNRRLLPTVKHCELWVKDRDKDGAYTCLQLVYPDILIEGGLTRRNIMGGDRLAYQQPFIKVEPSPVHGYFWGRSIIADIQMLQDVISGRLSGLQKMWDKNAGGGKALSGFTGLTPEMYYKAVSAGGYMADPNPNAKVTPLAEPPPQGYLEELEFLWRMFDEVGGFTPIMTGHGESGVRAGVHAQTLVKTSSPALIDPATRIERSLADSGTLCTMLMQDRDDRVYKTERQESFIFHQLPDGYQMVVDSHSASPAFSEDSKQIAGELGKAGIISGEDVVEMIHPPNAELILSRMRERAKQKAEAERAAAAQGLPPPGQQPQAHGRANGHGARH